ncbi:MAG: VWA domain-containing protein [Dehalococcoidia bacterium]|nr:VWA domain-containing protein [Dehalococcoidia bacterium]
MQVVGAQPPGPVQSQDQPGARVKPIETPGMDRPVGQTFEPIEIELPKDRKPREAKGKRSQTKSKKPRGRYVGSRPSSDAKDIALDATIRAAAPRQKERMAEHPGQENMLHIRMEDLHSKIRQRKVGNLLLFVVDASGSMGVGQRMSAAKGAVLSLLSDAYQRRDKVGMITFSARKAQMVLDPTPSVERAKDKLKNISVGGTTPLSAGLIMAYELAKRERLRHPDLLPLLILMTDGHGNVAVGSQDPMVEAMAVARMIKDEGFESLILDSENMLNDPSGFRPKGSRLIRQLAEAMDARYVQLRDLSKESVLQAVRWQPHWP